MDFKMYLHILKKIKHFDSNDYLFFSFLLLDNNNDGFICLNDLFELLKLKN